MSNRFRWYKVFRKMTQTLFVVIIIMFAGALLLQNVMFDWEVWMRPVLLGAIAVTVSIQIFQSFSEFSRELAYSLILMTLVFYYGVHTETAFEIPAMVVLAMHIYSMTSRQFFVYIGMGVGLFTLGFHVYYSHKNGGIPITAEQIIRMGWQFVIIIVSAIAIGYLIRVWKRTGENNDEYIWSKEKHTNDMRDYMQDIAEFFSKQLEKGTDIQPQLTNIVDYLKGRKGELEIVEEKYETATLLSIPTFRLKAEERQLKVGFSIDSSMPEFLVGDYGKIKAIIALLVDNSIKYTEKGSVQIKLDFIKQEYGINLEIEVSDTGCGIDNDKIDAIFSNVVPVCTENGIGMGIPLINEYLNLLGGFMRAESEENIGTNVTVSIPQRIARSTD